MAVPSHGRPTDRESTTTSNASTLGQPSKNRIVVTSPPWAKDEPVSPLLDGPSTCPEGSSRGSGTSTTQLPSEYSSTHPEALSDHHRWSFALPHPRPKLKRRRSSDSSLSQGEEDPTAERRPQLGSSRPSRTRRSHNVHTYSALPRTQKQEAFSSTPSQVPQRTPLRLELPLPSPKVPFTLPFTQTPGWNSPWAPRIPEQGFGNMRDTERCAHGITDVHEIGVNKEATDSAPSGLDSWHRRRGKIRNFFLRNDYVPLVSRLANLTFTTVALALAVRIRIIQEAHHLRGAVGSSSVLIIIFAPLTVVHVMLAIYLEYFGRPLGLWRTSAKLAHTLSDVVFICAWSAELALCFDNYVTSFLNCAPRSMMRWYSELPPVEKPLGDNATTDLKVAALTICDYQLDLIGVVMFALLLYVTNLVISLFRIFEKVKVHHGFR